MKADIRAIAFYLPQFHPIAENDAWWGAGFTEWTNVRKAVPLFPGHHQPHVPGPLGYYDLRDPRARQAQAELAGAHGIHGFCYYHYWFNGKRLLETPFNEVLSSGQPGFPFCLCWANENWTRRWDGEDREILVAQNHSHADDLAHIESLLPAFRDDRYIRVDGKPLFLVYKTALLPDPRKTAEIWREAAQKSGVGDLYLVRVENFLQELAPPPRDIGFDAAVEFAPHWRSIGPQIGHTVELGAAGKKAEPHIYDYDTVMLSMLDRPKDDYKLFRGAFPSWDNCPRRQREPTLFVNSTPEKYAFWLSQIGRHTLDTFTGDERLVFINAWNEWGEGCHLEPDERHGTRYLEATRLALRMARDLHDASAPAKPVAPSSTPEKWYEFAAGLYQASATPSSGDLALLGSFGPRDLFNSSPAPRNRIRAWVADLYAWLRWRITRSMRKLRSRGA